MAHIVVIGGGLAGLAAAAALGGDGHDVEILEAKPFPGGRAASYEIPGLGADASIDNCQHILLRCCVNLLDFYRRLGVEDAIEFHSRINFIEPGGRISTMEAGALPAPLHFTGSFASLKFLSLADKLAIARALLALRSERLRRTDLDAISMLDWLREKRQTPGAIERFWHPVLVSAINEDLGRMAAAHGFQVFWLGFMASKTSYQMGIPKVPLSQLYSERNWASMPGVEFRFRSAITAIRAAGSRITGIESGGETLTADHYVSALPSDRLALLAPELGIEWSRFEPSPITGIHLWFDRPVTALPHGSLLDRTIQWFFNKRDGRYLQLVVSASHSLTKLSKNDIVALALRELAEFLPGVSQATLLEAHVVKEMKATFSAAPGLEAHRPGPGTVYENLSLAGDWTRSGWPSTMEGAVRSGYIAASHATARLGAPSNYLLPDIA